MHREISLTKKILDAKPTNKHSLNQVSICNRHGVDTIFATVGIGGVDIEKILPILVNEYFVTDVLVIGYAGSTVKSINSGDLILCTEACQISDQIITNAASSYSSVNLFIYLPYSSITSRSRRSHRSCRSRDFPPSQRLDITLHHSQFELC